MDTYTNGHSLLWTLCKLVYKYKIDKTYFNIQRKFIQIKNIYFISTLNQELISNKENI